VFNVSKQLKHKHWFALLYHDNCAPCRVRRFRYGYRLDPVGYMDDRNKIFNDKRLTIQERLWILDQVRPIIIEE